MKALSIRHPWVDLILAGTKTIEIRTWATRYRGRLLLHASAGYGIAERDASARLGWGRPAPETLGAIVGVANLLDCRHVQPADWPNAALPPLEGKLWAWVLSEPQAMGPIACPGQRTLFDVDEALVAALA
jgi:hypothetical protein